MHVDFFNLGLARLADLVIGHVKACVEAHSLAPNIDLLLGVESHEGVKASNQVHNLICLIFKDHLLWTYSIDDVEIVKA